MKKLSMVLMLASALTGIARADLIVTLSTGPVANGAVAFWPTATEIEPYLQSIAVP